MAHCPQSPLDPRLCAPSCPSPRLPYHLAGDSTPAQHAAALQLLGAAVAVLPDAAGGLCSPEVVIALARFVGAPEAPLVVQADAADLLSTVAAVPVKREGVQQALTDHVLPRAFEIVHEAASAAAEAAEAGGSNGGSSSGGASADAAAAAAAGAEATQRRRLQASAAAIVAQLVQQDRECCHSILFHAQLLSPAVQMLVSGGRYAAAQQLLAAAHAYANSLAPASGGAGSGTGAATSGEPAAVAPA